MSRRAFTVALIGPDGAGKTSIARRLERELGVPAKYLYMGVSRESSSHMLPTTRIVRAIKRRRGAPPDTGGPPDSTRPREAAGSRRPRAVRVLRSGARLVNQLAEESYRELLARYHVRRGSVVLFDRHFFFDYHAFDVVRRDDRPLEARIHGFVLERVYPRPDLVVYLDAPAEVMLARKGEGTLEALERRRGEYLALANVAPTFATVDASGSLDDVARAVADVVARFAATRGASANGSAPS